MSGAPEAGLRLVLVAATAPLHDGRMRPGHGAPAGHCAVDWPMPQPPLRHVWNMCLAPALGLQSACAL